MSKIRVMDELLSNKIAAGEVVERCVSIVKELVENAIDAGSTEIKIVLKEAGLREIKVIDDGIGMDRDDALLAFQRHATSKLYSDDDLFAIHSLGFRGEAMPSIASVSEVMLKTCAGEVGTLIHIKGGKVLENKECEPRRGTVVTVNNLFFNTPARLKHLGSYYSELANITEYVHKMALSYPKVKFILVNSDKELLNTDGSGNLLKVIKQIYGLDIAKKMIKVSGSNDDYAITGYVSLPEVNRSSRNYISTLVNGRVVRNTILNRTINDAYSGFKEDSRYPIVVLEIEVDPTLIDVNIHPSKLDIKFSNFDDLQLLVKEMIRDALNDKLLIPKMEVKEKDNNIQYENISLDLERNSVKENNQEYLNKVYDKINMDDKEEEENLTIINNNYIDKVDIKDKLPELYPVGLALGTYIVCQNEKGLYLMDQHAAQERINYEKYIYLLSHPNNNVITPLVPIVIELPLNEFLIIKENIEILSNINVNLEPFGTSSFRVVSHPTWFPKGREDMIIRQMMEMIVSRGKDFSLEKFNNHVAATMACKASVKGNTRISTEDQESIINDLRKCDNPFNCPHGRPTIIHFSIYELEKMFKRSM